MTPLLTTLALTLFAAPEPWPEASCKSAFGTSACGYDCVAAFGEVRCARTPYGKCLSGFGKVTCADPSLHTLHVYHGALPQMQCKAAFGDVACGYDCKAGFGEVRCAEAPDGKCEAAYGKVTCWSPDARDRPHTHPYHEPILVDPQLVEPPPHRPGRPRDPKATCKSAFGATACGYDCVAAFGQVKCAETPLGACKAAFGDIVCADPPAWARGHAWGSAAKVRCDAAFGKIACGYGCVSAYGDIRCARSPRGTCQAAYGDIVCSE